MILVSEFLIGSEIVEVFWEEVGDCVEDMASPILDIGSTVAYDRIAKGERNMGRADARRRDVEGRKAAIV